MLSIRARDTLAERYEHMMARVEQITRAVYQVEVQWECEFVDGILARHPELKTRLVVHHSSLTLEMPCTCVGGHEPSA